MAFSRVYVLCATAILALAKVHAAPTGGLFSGLFGGDDGRPQPPPATLDINQILRQYYTQQNDDQYGRYNPYAINYPPQPQPQPLPQPVPYNPYSSPDSMLNYQPNYNLGFDSGFGSLTPYYRGGPGASNGAEGAANPVDSLLSNSNEQAIYGDAAAAASSYRSLGVESQPQPVAAPAGAEAAQAPLTSSLLSHRILPAENSSSSQSVAAPNSANESAINKEQ